MDPRIHQIIVQTAMKYGLDPAAVLSVANVEGGIRTGAVGDNGTSFGPFQLHVGGALPSGKNAAWANSPAGIDYAIRQMSSSARGLQGKSAVAAIVTNFERPADIPGEIAKAYGGYGQFAGGNTGKVPKGGMAQPYPKVAPSLGSAEPVNVLAQQFANTARNQLIQSSIQLAQTGDVSAYTNSLIGLAQQRRMYEAASQQFGSTDTLLQKNGVVDPHGSTTAPQTRSIPGSAGGAAIVNSAAQQIGQPYVWGGESRKEGGFDCSGLVDWSARQHGYQGPRLTTYNIAKMGTSVKGQPLKPGDLVLANNGEHVVIYAGDGKVIAAPHTGTVVQYQPLSKFNITDVRRPQW